jgi:hypothetical protein
MSPGPGSRAAFLAMLRHNRKFAAEPPFQRAALDRPLTIL